MSAPFMQLYVADYLGDTQHLTAEQHGAYLLLLMTMWRQGGSLPNDPRMLARIARVSPRRWHLIAPEVMAFFDEEAGTITQKRLVEEYQKAVSKSEKRSASGKLGGEAKSLKSRKGAVANAKQMPKHLLQKPEPEEEEAKASPSPARDDEQAAFDLFNEAAHRNGLPVAEKLTKERRGKLKARLSDADGLDGWGRAIARVEASDFCTGRKTDFRADLDFLLQPKSFRRLMEGSYDNNRNQRGQDGQRYPTTGKPSIRDQIREGVRSVSAGDGVRGPVEASRDGRGPEWPDDERPGGVASRTLSFERGTGGSYEDRPQHQPRYADARH